MIAVIRERYSAIGAGKEGEMAKAQKWLAVAVAVSLLIATTPGLRGEVAAENRAVGIVEHKISHFFEMAAGELSGTVLYSDGKTPVGEAPVRVWSAKEEKFIFETTTDKRGAYVIGELSPGTYYVIFADRVVSIVHVKSKAFAQMGLLNVVIPKGTPGLSREEISAMLARAGQGFPKLKLLPTIIIAGLIAAAIAIPLALADDDDKHRAVTSP